MAAKKEMAVIVLTVMLVTVGVVIKVLVSEIKRIHKTTIEEQKQCNSLLYTPRDPRSMISFR